MAIAQLSQSDNQTDPSSKRGRLERLRSQLKNEQESFITHYKELSQFFQPRRGRFFITDHNKGNRRHKSIINSKGTMALNTATAGMIAGTMSPSQPWFKSESFNTDLNKIPRVKQWFYYTDLIVREIFNSSNLYAMASPTIKETLLFGTGCMSQVDDYDNVARFYSHTAGSYMIAQNDKYEVDTVIREFEMTVAQIVSKFSKKDQSTGQIQVNPDISPKVKEAYARGQYNSWYPVVHVTEPNELYTGNNPTSKYKRFASCYYEPGNPDSNLMLSESGFDFFPFYCPRWDVTGEDIYGTDCPGMTALGDVKALQLMEKRKAQALDKIVNPPLKGPPSLRNVPLSSLPGGANIYTKGPNDDALGPLYQINNLNLGELRLNMDAHEKRIDSTFYVDMFLSISTMEGVQPQNELYLSQRNQERLLQLGPVLERIHGDFLSNMISRTYYQALRAGILPPLPPELRGQAVKVRYISTMAQAQRSVGTSTIDRYAAFAGGLVKAGWTDAALKFNASAAMDVYGDDIGIPPQVVNSDDQVAQVKQQQAQEMQKAQQTQAMTTGASAFKDVGSAVKSLSDPASRAAITGDASAPAGRNNI